jgi:hypothetical protein
MKKLLCSIAIIALFFTSVHAAETQKEKQRKKEEKSLLTKNRDELISQLWNVSKNLDKDVERDDLDKKYKNSKKAEIVTQILNLKDTIEVQKHDKALAKKAAKTKKGKTAEVFAPADTLLIEKVEATPPVEKTQKAPSSPFLTPTPIAKKEEVHNTATDSALREVNKLKQLIGALSNAINQDDYQHSQREKELAGNISSMDKSSEINDLKNRVDSANATAAAALTEAGKTKTDSTVLSHLNATDAFIDRLNSRVTTGFILLCVCLCIIALVLKSTQQKVSALIAATQPGKKEEENTVVTEERTAELLQEDVTPKKKRSLLPLWVRRLFGSEVSTPVVEANTATAEVN